MADEEQLRRLLQPVANWTASMIGEELLAQFERGGHKFWNLWRKHHPLAKIDFECADLSGYNFGEVNFSRANLRGANLQRVNLENANLTEANLRGANLQGAKLKYANLQGADLREASLIDVNLRYANLRRADLSRADLRGANLRKVDLREANLKAATLRHVMLVETSIEEAIFTDCSIYGLSAWDLQGSPKEQNNLVITRKNEPVVSVDDLEVAQFMYLLLNHKKLRNVLNSVTERGVLILGRFGDGGLAILQSIAAKLREHNYLPIIFDFDRPDDRNYTETIKILAGLSRFVIADLSGPSVPQELYATVPHFKIPFAPILEERRKPFSMAVDLFEYPWVLPLMRYSSKEQLITELPTRVIEPAEQKHKARQALLTQLFHQT